MTSSFGSHARSRGLHITIGQVLEGAVTASFKFSFSDATEAEVEQRGDYLTEKNLCCKHHLLDPRKAHLAIMK